MFRGSIIDTEFRGISTIQIMNMLGPDIITLGNHEIDYGLAHLLFLEKCAELPIVNANMHVTTNHKRLFDPCKIIEIDGMKVLFIGIITEIALSACIQVIEELLINESHQNAQGAGRLIIHKEDGTVTGFAI